MTCRWLIDPRADSGERIGRDVALLLDNYANRRDFEHDFGLPVENLKPPAKSGADRRAELLAERTAHKIGVVKVPKMTALFGGYSGLEPGPGRATSRRWPRT